MLTAPGDKGERGENGSLRPADRAGPDETVACGLAGAQEAAFLAAATQILARGWEPVRPAAPPPKERSWLPGHKLTGAEPARFSARHPDLWFAFPDVVQRSPPRRRRCLIPILDGAGGERPDEPVDADNGRPRISGSPVMRARPGRGSDDRAADRRTIPPCRAVAPLHPRPLSGMHRRKRLRGVQARGTCLPARSGGAVLRRKGPRWRQRGTSTVS